MSAQVVSQVGKAPTGHIQECTRHLTANEVTVSSDIQGGGSDVSRRGGTKLDAQETVEQLELFQKSQRSSVSHDGPWLSCDSECV